MRCAMTPHLDGHDPTLQPVKLECPEVGGDIWRIGLAAEQVEAENSMLLIGLNRPLIGLSSYLRIAR